MVYIEDQAVLQSYDLAHYPALFPPLPSACGLSFSVFLCVADRAYSWGGGGGGEGVDEDPNHTTARNPGFL